MNRPVPVVAGVCVAVLHARFLRLLPKLETHARIVFRGVRCPVKQADRVQECIALAWKWFVRLSGQGKDGFAFPMAFAALVARALWCGRKLCGQERAGDVLSFVAQARHGFRVERLPATTRSPHEQLYADPHGQTLLDALEERLRDNTLTPVPDQAAFRIDFPLSRPARRTARTGAAASPPPVHAARPIDLRDGRGGPTELATGTSTGVPREDHA
jgi:hypothetical protein